MVKVNIILTLACVAASSSAYDGHVERELILSGEIVPIGTKTYFADDFMLMELERPSKYKPVRLATADDSDFKPGKMAATMGWGTNTETNGNASAKLQRMDVPLVSDEACIAYTTVGASMVCAVGVANRDSCGGDSGGPLIVESADGEDVLIGVVSWAKNDTCGREGYYGVYSRVSSARPWIDAITGGSGTCLA
ncbi:unnamed protein product [Phytophthora fragariaefolia]|uniref:Unnamed protein product n=1 Tax=Phytophthora fragariaefolia TaxID=1490495 RepID=A0A9W6XCB1_9STRA|nr:unnamed protein product [Phytophthora fragariaefolia]